jgi:NTP pyrophosphatase (non-canonical NTP hydrolase)
MKTKQYQEFVKSVTSTTSTNFDEYIASLTTLNQSVNIATLDTGVTGMSAESGEFLDIIKKLKFQGKPLSDDVKFHMIRELGDIMFYWTMACSALGVEPAEVIAENIKKLAARYPDGFSVTNSENKPASDV